MSYYVYSTLTNDQNYQDYHISDDKNMLPVVKSTIFIKGGNGISNKHFITPRGVVTEVSDEQMCILEKNTDFITHRKNGHVKVESRQYAPELVAADMKEVDNSSPLTPKNYSKRIKVVPGSEEVETPKAVLSKDSKKAA